MEEPLNLVKLTELLHLERRSRALIPRRSELHEDVAAAIESGVIPPEDAERALQTARDILFLRRRKVLLLAADMHGGGRPEARGLTPSERLLLSRAVDLLREMDPLDGGRAREREAETSRRTSPKTSPKTSPAGSVDAAGAPPTEGPPTVPPVRGDQADAGPRNGTGGTPGTADVPAKGEASTGTPPTAGGAPDDAGARGRGAAVAGDGRTPAPAREAAPPAGPVEDRGRGEEGSGAPLPLVPSPGEVPPDDVQGAWMATGEDRPSTGPAGQGESVILRALDDIDFVSLERTYLVRRDDVFTVDAGTAEILVRSGKVARVIPGDAA